MADPLDLDALAATCEAATPGPWDWTPDEGGTDLHGWPMDATVRFGDRGKYGYPNADARYIATFDPPTVAALIAKARRAEALEELVRLMPEPECGATIGEGVVAYRCNNAPHGQASVHAECDHDDGSGVQAEWQDDDPHATPSPWTSDALALLAAVTSDGDVDRG